MAEIKDMLDGVIRERIDKMGSDESTEEEKAQAIRDVTQLHKLRIEEIKAQAEVEDKQKRFEEEQQKNARQARDTKIDRIVKIAVGAVELLVPLGFYGMWMKQGFMFEEKGSFTSTTFKNLFSRFRPTK